MREYTVDGVVLNEHLKGTTDAPSETAPGTDEALWGEVQTAAEREAAEKAESTAPPAPEAKQKAKGPATAELIAPVIDMIAGIAPPPEISPAERKLLTESAADLVDHLFPGGLEQWGPWYTFALVWGAVFAPRVIAASRPTAEIHEIHPTNDGATSPPPTDYNPQDTLDP